ncbi:L,D-transpeptidase [Promicromonospora aerolata]|uniref:L,D-transpeptidase n=1 Tax=Promicromonospora aerolata TaxID=195749 RepID=A0ABW4VCB9_9MICO
MTETHSGPTAEAGPRRPGGRTWAWVAGIVAVALLGSALWASVRPVDKADAAAVVVTSPSPSPSPSPSATPSPPKPRPTPAEYSLTDLPRPDIDAILPRGLPRADVGRFESLPGSVAEPTRQRIPVWTQPDVTTAPVLALESEYYEADARWLVLERRPGWVKVLVPYGRGALPSRNPEKVNGAAGWLRAKDVDLEREKRSVVIDLSERTVTVKHADGTSDELPAAVGAPGTPTPQGLTQVFTVTEAVNTGLSVFLSMQSESLDGFFGTDYAATALHVGVGQGQAVSNGCVRLTSADFERLTDLEPGVPVLVRA